MSVESAAESVMACECASATFFSFFFALRPVLLPLPEMPPPKSAPPFILDPERLPVVLWAPNLLGYARVAFLLFAMAEKDKTSLASLRLLFASLALDYFDGPCARALNMCSQFGDLLDHFCDHATMAWLVYITSPASSYGVLNNAVSVVCNLFIAMGFMLVKGHYFKHAASANWITSTVEANNYWNLLSLLWAANQMIIPCVKLSYHAQYPAMAATDSTELLDFTDALGLAVTAIYSLACIHAAVAAPPVKGAGSTP